MHEGVQERRNRSSRAPSMSGRGLDTGLEKEEELEMKLPTFAGFRENKGISEKTSISVSLTDESLWLCGS